MADLPLRGLLQLKLQFLYDCIPMISYFYQTWSCLIQFQSVLSLCRKFTPRRLMKALLSTIQDSQIFSFRTAICKACSKSCMTGPAESWPPCGLRVGRLLSCNSELFNTWSFQRHPETFGYNIDSSYFTMNNIYIHIKLHYIYIYMYISCILPIIIHNIASLLDIGNLFDIVT